jgi:glutamine synthetase
MLAGILGTVADMTVFLNPSKQSFHRLGFNKAPKYISWSSENRSQLIRIPAATGEYRRAELRSPDPLANPYIAYTLLIYAGLYGIQNKLELPEPANVNLFTADAETLAKYKTLPLSLAEARKRAFDSSFVRDHLPLSLIEYFCNR